VCWYIQPGKPQQNTYFERYNRTARHEWLDQIIFETTEEARNKPQTGSGHTTTTGPTWPSVGSNLQRNWKCPC